MGSVIKQAASKREQQKEIRRNEIIDAGLLAFTANGFNSTKLDDVAELAGIGKGTIYLYFDSKESLFEAVVHKSLIPDISLEEQGLLEKQSAEQVLVSIIKSMYLHISQENIPQLMAMIIGEAARFPRLSEFIFTELIKQRHEILKKVILKGIEQGEFCDIGYQNYPQIIISPILSAATWKLQFDSFSPMDLETFEKMHIETVLKALKQ